MKCAKGKPRPANSGRRKGSPNRTERARRLISEADDKAIVRQVVKDAKANNPAALSFYFRHLRPPPPKETFIGPIDYVAPKTVDEARAAILELGERLAKREISLEAHDALINGIRTYLGDQAAEQRKKLDELEESLRSGDSS
jgi:hypothetical protein